MTMLSSVHLGKKNIDCSIVADLYMFCHERDFMLSLSDKNHADVIEAFNSTLRYLDDLLNIDNPYLEHMSS